MLASPAWIDGCRETAAALRYAVERWSRIRWTPVCNSTRLQQIRRQTCNAALGRLKRV